MTKADFLRALNDRLSALGEGERERCAAYYDEILSDRIEEGMDEAAAVAGMEPVDEIARRILSEGVPERQAAPSAGKVVGWRLALLALGAPLWVPLVVAAVAVAATLLAVLWVAWLALAAAVVALLVGGVAAALGSLIFLARQPASGLFMLGTGLVVAALGLLAYRPIMSWALGTARLTQRSGHALQRAFRRREAT